MQVGVIGERLWVGRCTEVLIKVMVKAGIDWGFGRAGAPHDLQGL